MVIGGTKGFVKEGAKKEKIGKKNE